MSALLGRFFDSGTAAKDDQVGKRDPLVAGLSAVEVLLDLFQRLQHLGEFGRLVDFPILLRLEANPCAVGAAAFVGAAERRGGCPGGRDQLRNGQSRGEDLALEGRDILIVNHFVVGFRNRVLPQLRLGNQRAEAARDGPHVAGRQFVPRLGEGFLELFRGVRGSVLKSSRRPGPSSARCRS